MKKKILSLLFVFFSGCAQTPTHPGKSIVLIQGVHLDGSAWNEVKKQLLPSGYYVTDLGRMGRDEKDAASLAEIASLSCETIEPASILVAHSYGGAISNAMVGKCPDKITKIIYVSALVPLKGEKPFERMKKVDEKAYGKAVGFEELKIVPKDAKIFFKTTDPFVNVNKPLPKLYPEWASLNAEAVPYDETKFKAIPKIYIYTTKDPIIHMTTQSNYVNKSGIKVTDNVPTGHYPMISNPEALGKLILKYADAKN